MTQLERRKYSLKKNDVVQVIAGKDKGKSGKILKVNFKTGRVTVEKINLGMRHTRPTQKSTGGIVEKEIPIHYSNILLFCNKCSRGVRHKMKITDDSKIRVCKRCDGSLEI